jgi:hypothetical protein
MATVGLAGTTAMDANAAGVTVTFIWPVILPEVAVMIALPETIPVIKPEDETVTTLLFELLQLTPDVRGWVLPSLNFAVTLS